MDDDELRSWFDQQVVVCNQDRGSWAATKRLADAFGLSEPRD